MHAAVQMPYDVIVEWTIEVSVLPHCRSWACGSVQLKWLVAEFGMPALERGRGGRMSDSNKA